MHVSQKHSHGCHCTTGDIIVFQACTALTSLDLYNCSRLTGDIVAFQACTALTSLDLSGDESDNMKFTGSKSKLLKALPTLRDFNVLYSGVSE